MILHRRDADAGLAQGGAASCPASRLTPAAAPCWCLRVVFIAVDGLQLVHAIQQRPHDQRRRRRVPRAARALGRADGAAAAVGPGSRRRLLGGLVALGILLGLWGVAQFLLRDPLRTAPPTRHGRGDVHHRRARIGLFASRSRRSSALAVLMSGRPRSDVRAARALGGVDPQPRRARAHVRAFLLCDRCLGVLSSSSARRTAAAAAARLGPDGFLTVFLALAVLAPRSSAPTRRAWPRSATTRAIRPLPTGWSRVGLVSREISKHPVRGRGWVRPS